MLNAKESEAIDWDSDDAIVGELSMLEVVGGAIVPEVVVAAAVASLGLAWE